MNDRNNEALQRYIAQNLSGLNVAPQRPPATPLGTGIAGMGGNPPVAQPSPFPPRNLGIAEFEGSITPQLPQSGVVPPGPTGYRTPVRTLGKPIDLHPPVSRPDGSHRLYDRLGEQGFVELGGLFGSDNRTIVQKPVGGWSFEDFMTELMNSGKNEDASRVTRDITPEQWAKQSPIFEDQYTRPYDPYNNPEANRVLGTPDDRPNSMDREGSDNRRGRQANWMLTPEERGAVADEFYRENPWLVTPRGNRLSKDLPQEVQDAIKQDYLLKKWLEQNT